MSSITTSKQQNQRDRTNNLRELFHIEEKPICFHKWVLEVYFSFSSPRDKPARLKKIIVSYAPGPVGLPTALRRYCLLIRLFPFPLIHNHTFLNRTECSAAVFLVSSFFLFCCSHCVYVFLHNERLRFTKSCCLQAIC